MNDSWTIFAKFIVRILSILSIICLAWLSVYMLLEGLPWFAGFAGFAGFVTYLSIVLSVLLSSTFWGAGLKKFKRDIAVAHVISLLAAWSICFSGFPVYLLWIKGIGDFDFTAASQRAALLGSLPGFLALLILLLATWVYLYIKIKSPFKRPNS